MVNLRGDADVASFDPNRSCPFEQGASSGTSGLESDEEHAVAFMRQCRLQVVEHSPAGRHATRRDDDGRLTRSDEFLRLLR